MAILDARLLPLIEALAVVDADWLAFEILDGLRLGQVAEESRDNLQSTRNAVRSVKRPARRSEEWALLPSSAAVPILGEEQIDWAANYVAKRISDAVLMLQAGLDQLEEIVSGTQPLDRSPSASAEKVGITLVLQTDDQGLSVSRDDAANATAALLRLHEALRAWVASTRNGNVSE